MSEDPIADSAAIRSEGGDEAPIPADATAAELDRPYAAAAIVSTFTPILVLVVSFIARMFLPAVPAVQTGMLIFASLCLSVGLLSGFRALKQAGRVQDAKYILRSGAGVFANAILLLFIGISLLMMQFQA